MTTSILPTNSHAIYNSEILSYSSSDLEFKTSSVLSDDEVHNVLTYNYGSGGFSLGNDSSKIFFPKINQNPLFRIANIESQLFTISDLMANDFIPLPTSPIKDAGNNAFVLDIIPTDILGNERIFDFDTVDIGPYELMINKILFSSDDIIKLFQDKLNLDTIKRAYNPTNDDTVYYDLYDQFFGNESYREEFARESKIIIRLKDSVEDYRLLSDKENVEIVDFEAYYDLSSKSIVVTKKDDILGDMLSNVFKDDRYIFYFDELNHSLKVYINNTYDKGLSGNRNAVKSVKFGGPGVFNA